VKTFGLSNTGAQVDVRLEGFNVFNRANFGPPALTAFSGVDGQGPLATFGRIRSTVTSSRQLQVGVRLAW
jgi:hypothetical protein